MKASTIKKAIEKRYKIESTCWVNALTDFYKDTLMNEKTRKRLTVERIVEILGRNIFFGKRSIRSGNGKRIYRIQYPS